MARLSWLISLAMVTPGISSIGSGSEAIPVGMKRQHLLGILHALIDSQGVYDP
jgi:hypothetical protein